MSNTHVPVGLPGTVADAARPTGVGRPDGGARRRAARPPVVVVGGAPAALTAADVLAESGETVLLLLPERGVGGGFRPIQRDRQVLQLGARTIELAAAGSAVVGLPSLEAYRPGPTGFVPWWPLATAYLLDLLEGDVRELPTPQLFVDGAWGDDAYLTVDLAPLARRTAPHLASRIAAEAAAAEAREGHPAGVLADEASLWSMTLGEATRRNAGPTFADWLIEPAAAKLIEGGAEQVVAAARRKLWLPLFWPRTVREAFSGDASGFRPDRRFHVDADGGTGRVVDALLRRLETHPSVRIERYRRVLRVEHQRIVVERADTAGVLAECCVDLERPAVLGVGTEELVAAVGSVAEALPRLELGVVWLTVRHPQLATPAMGFVTDGDVEAFRVSTNGVGVGFDGPVVTIELGWRVPAAQLARVATESMVRLGLCEHVDDVDIVDTWRGPAVPAPTVTAVAGHHRNVEQVAAARLPHHVVGGASAFGADSLNEQLVAGHAAAMAAREADAAVVPV